MSTSTSLFSENFDTYTMCTANSSADTSVMASPKPMDSSESEPESDTSPIPPTAMTEATRLNAVGRLRAMAHQANGTMTQYVAVRKAFLPGVVWSSPMVCTQNAR